MSACDVQAHCYGSRHGLRPCAAWGWLLDRVGDADAEVRLSVADFLLPVTASEPHPIIALERAYAHLVRWMTASAGDEAGLSLSLSRTH